MRRIAVLACLISFTMNAQAQVVRGVVTERVSGQRLAGVVVSVASAIDSVTPEGFVTE